MKRISMIVAAVFLTFCTLSCGKAESGENQPGETKQADREEYQVRVEVEKAQVSLSEAVSVSPYIFFATVDNLYYDEIGNYVAVVTPIEWLTGDTGEETATVRVLSDPIQVGQEYLFLAERWASVFTQTEFFVTNAVLFQKDGELQKDCIADDSKSLEELAEKVKAVLVENPVALKIKGDYIHSTVKEEIEAQSPEVFFGIVESVTYKLVDRMEIKVSVSETKKGTSSGSVVCIVPLDSVELGKSYLFYMKKPSEDSTFFTITSPYSIYPD